MRRRDGKIFLLDFGAVKQVTNAPVGAATSTGIYSMGFAPPEQMAGGQVFPSTDLYALAVTVVILLTGEEITQLFDVYNNQWKWRSQVTLSPRLADILDKMLLAAANQRFQSAQEVLDALDSQSPPIPPTQVNPRQPQPQPQPIQKITRQPFSLLEMLTGAAFSGFEGGLIAIPLFSLLKSPPITLAASAVILGILIFAQTRRWIEKWDLLIIPAISFAIIFFVLIKFLHVNIDIQLMLFLAVVAGLVAIALTSLFRLIYKLLSLLL